MTENTPSPLDSLIADFRVTRKRLKDKPPTSIKGMVAELVNNVYPSMIALAEQIAEVDEVVFELSEQGDSYIQPDLAAQILVTIALGTRIIDEYRKHLEGMSDIEQQRIKELLNSFEQAMELTKMGVYEASVDEEAPPEEEDTKPGKKISEPEKEEGENV